MSESKYLYLYLYLFLRVQMYLSLCVPHCLLPRRIRNVTIARFASVTQLQLCLSVYLPPTRCALFSVSLTHSCPRRPSEHLVQFYYALHCILLTVLSTSVENWLNINICTHPRFVCRTVCRNIYYNGNNSFASQFIYKCEYK